MWSRPRQWLEDAVTRCWAAGFATARSRGAAHWSAMGGVEVLVVAPHPEDEVAGCAGTMLRHLEAGDDVTVVFATDGRRSRAMGLDPAAMAIRRRDESTASCRVLGIERYAWLGLPEGEWRDADLRDELARLLTRRPPAVIYAPSCVDFHPEHVRVATVLAAALSDRAGDGDAVVRIYQVQVPLTRILVNLVTPVARSIEQVRQAVDQYASQRGSLLRCERIKGYAARCHGVPTAAEEFWQLPVARYAGLHRRMPGPDRRFRGLRASALTDPLAYLQGRHARRRLAGRSPTGRPGVGQVRA